MKVLGQLFESGFQTTPRIDCESEEAVHFGLSPWNGTPKRIRVSVAQAKRIAGETLPLLGEESQIVVAEPLELGEDTGYSRKVGWEYTFQLEPGDLIGVVHDPYMAEREPERRYAVVLSPMV